MEDNDLLGWARLTNGNNEIILVTNFGKALRFSEKVIRPTGRSAGGISGIHLDDNDKVASMEVIEEKGDLMLVTTLGYGKRTPLSEYPSKGRATRGVQSITKGSESRLGPIAAARVVQEGDDVTLISSGGMVLRMKVKDVKQSGRATRGVRLMGVKEGDRVASIARTAKAELKKAGADINGSPSPKPGEQIDLPLR